MTNDKCNQAYSLQLKAWPSRSGPADRATKGHAIQELPD